MRLVTDGGEPVAGMQWDLHFDPAVAAVVARVHGAPDCSIDTGVNKGATGFAFRPSRCDPRRGDCTAVRAVVLALDNVDTIPSGAAVARCRLAVARDARPGRYQLTTRGALYSTPDGGDRRVRPHTGELEIVAVGPEATPTPERSGGASGGCALTPATATARRDAALVLLPVLLFAAGRWRRARRGLGGPVHSTARPGRWLVGIAGLVGVHPAPAAGVVRIDGSEALGRPGTPVTVTLTLVATAGERVAGTQNDLRIDPRYFTFAVRPDGSPACSANPGIGKGATAFGFRPRGCGPAGPACATVRALVLAFDSVEPIPSGSVLYSCVIGIAPATPAGTYELNVEDVLYAAPPPAVGDRAAGGSRGRIVVQAVVDRADVNCDGAVDVADLRAIYGAVFAGHGACRPDCNGDAAVGVADLVCVGRRVMSGNAAAILTAHERRRWMGVSTRLGTDVRSKEGR